jgi:lipopolysaccharide transport system ATP-binding protein
MAVEIIAQDLVVEFPVYDNSHRSLKKKVLNLSTGGRIAQDSGSRAVVNALDTVSFDFREGDRIGLVGHNGSGKTTLLRVLSGVYEPVGGSLILNGRVASLLDVSMGLDPDATGFENIYLRGILEGLRPEAVRKKVDDIAEFSDLGDYLNFPIRTYSSGMMLRLAFSISTSVEADILLMDEWLSVGDAEFNEKATERLESLVSNASILVIASHNPDLISRVCNRKISLEHGKVVGDVTLPDLSSGVSDNPVVETDGSQKVHA